MEEDGGLVVGGGGGWVVGGGGDVCLLWGGLGGGELGLGLEAGFGFLVAGVSHLGEGLREVDGW